MPKQVVPVMLSPQPASTPCSCQDVVMMPELHWLILKDWYASPP
jgi:hypothetical protein